jgi:hypothetical protein
MAEENQETPPMAEDIEGTPKKSNTRKKKELPPELSNISIKDGSMFKNETIIDRRNDNLPTFNKLIDVAKTIKIDDNLSFEINDLSIDQIRVLCKKIGMRYCGNRPKLECRILIADHFKFHDTIAHHNLKPTWYASKVTSSICRVVNVVFSESFVEDFKKVNDRKSRQDHETARTYKSFWNKTTKAFNSCIDNDNNNNTTGKNDEFTDFDDGTTVAQSLITQDFSKIDRDDNNRKAIGNIEIDLENADDNTASSVGNRSDLTEDDNNEDFGGDDFTTIVNVSKNTYITTDLVGDTDLDLLSVNRLSVEAFRKKVLDLFRIRQKVFENMTKSGTHGNNEWDFVEGAMKGFQGFTKISVFYFFTRCDEVKDIDCNFLPFLDEGLKGDSTTRDSTSAGSTKSKKRKADQDNNVAGLADQGNRLMALLMESQESFKIAAEDRKIAAEDRKIAAIDRKEAEANKQKRASLLARIEIAKSLKNKDKLEKLMEELEKDL